VIRVALLGASGFVGGELLRLCAAHPHLHLVQLFGDSHAGSSVAAVHPHLALAYPELRLKQFDPVELRDVDLVFASLPHGVTQTIAPHVIDRGLRFVDLGADFRLSDPDAYERWYGEAHRAPALLSEFSYGIPETNREAIRVSRNVAAAGCYPTAAILACKPLFDAGLIAPGTLIIDAVSGVSGAGRAAKEATAFNTVSGSFAAYGLFTHRHTVELQAALGQEVLFTPHLAPMNRGILATCYGTAAREMEDGEPLAVLRAAYAGEPFVHVTEASPATKWTLGSNAVQITARYDPRTGRVLAIAALDNLVKGAAGQMIQCANLMFGLEETAGLPVCGVYP